MAEKTLVYQLWPYAWGSIRMMTLMLSRIAALGADYVWLSPIFASPNSANCLSFLKESLNASPAQ